jgi:septum formation protein
MRLILASSSPRRREILALLGLPFECVDPKIEEKTDPSRTPEQEALHWAVRKANVVSGNRPGDVVLASDTLIDLGGETIGKPGGHDEAFRILRRLAGRTHRVVTAVAVVGGGKTEKTAVESTTVRMRPSHDEILMRYAFTPEPLDKAGAYSLQGEGRRLIEGLDGDYLSAVGLPLRAVAALLRESGISIRADVEAIYRERKVFNWGAYD